MATAPFSLAKGQSTVVCRDARVDARVSSPWPRAVYAARRAVSRRMLSVACRLACAVCCAAKEDKRAVPQESALSGGKKYGGCPAAPLPGSGKLGMDGLCWSLHAEHGMTHHRNAFGEDVAKITRSGGSNQLATRGSNQGIFRSSRTCALSANRMTMPPSSSGRILCLP